MTTVLDILKLGLPGLVFLLAAFSYKLLAKEQDKATPCNDILRSIKHYLYVNLVLAMLTIASPFIDHILQSSRTINLQAVTNTDIQKGIAAVCDHIDELNHKYLLVKDLSSGKLIEVYSAIEEACPEDKEYIILNQLDVANLGWDLSNSSRYVEIRTSPNSHKVSI